MHASAALLMQYDQFKPFCKTGSDADHYRCALKESSWAFHGDHAVYTIKANRFLRGMVRLIVGSCINVGLGKVSLDEMKECLDNQSLLPHAWSVPAEGLFLEAVGYKDENV